MSINKYKKWIEEDFLHIISSKSQKPSESGESEASRCQLNIGAQQAEMSISFGPSISFQQPQLSPLMHHKLNHGNMPKKRKVEDENSQDHQKENRGTSRGSGSAVCSGRSRHFLHIPVRDGVYHTEQWKDKQTSMFQPITEDLLVSVRNAEQISVASGSYFVTDTHGQYSGSKEGQTLNLWRYDTSSMKLFISRSFLFTDIEVYSFVTRQLDEV